MSGLYRENYQWFVARVDKRSHVASSFLGAIANAKERIEVHWSDPVGDAKHFLIPIRYL